MRVLRISVHSPEGDSFATVIRDSDAGDSLESVRARILDHEGFTTCEIFDMPDDSIVAAAIEGRKRIDRKRESHMALLYYWNRERLRLLTGQGVLAQTQPTPLSVDDIKFVFERLSYTKDYKGGQSLVSISEDLNVVTYRDGEFTVEEPA